MIFFGGWLLVWFCVQQQSQPNTKKHVMYQYDLDQWIISKMKRLNLKVFWGE